MKLLIYVAGPYSSNPCHGCRAAIDAAEVLIANGYTPFVPHMSLVWDIAHPHTPTFWYDLDMKYLAHCDLLLRLPGTSWGCDRECEFCEAQGIPIFRGTAEQFVKANIGLERFEVKRVERGQGW